MIASVVVLAVSLFLFVFWFRCTVALILRSAPSAVDGAYRVAAANGLSFPEVRQQLLAQATTAALPELLQLLKKEYRALKYLLAHMTDRESGYSAEQRLVMAHFCLTGVWFAMVHRIRPRSARVALSEMSAVVEFLAGALNERSALAAQPAVVRT